MAVNLPTKRYDEAVANFQNADMLACFGKNFFTRGIRIASLSPFSHTGMLVKRNDEWAVLDVLQWRGGSSRNLQREVEKAPGRWVHFPVNTTRFPEFDRLKASRRMWEFDAVDYGWQQLGLASFAYLPGIRWFQKLDSFWIDDERSLTVPPFCSMAYSIAAEAGGIDPIPRLRHSMTTPGELSRSWLFDQANAVALVP